DWARAVPAAVRGVAEDVDLAHATAGGGHVVAVYQRDDQARLGGDGLAGHADSPPPAGLWIGTTLPSLAVALRDRRLGFPPNGRNGRNGFPVSAPCAPIAPIGCGPFGCLLCVASHRQTHGPWNPSRRFTTDSFSEARLSESLECPAAFPASMTSRAPASLPWFSR